MTGYTIPSAPSGENTAPDGSEKIPLSGSKFIQILNLIVRKIRETGGPTTLSMGAVTDGSYLKRDGNSIIGSNLTTDGGYRIVPTVSANDLVLSVKLEDGTTDPSVTSPLYFKIGNTVRSCTAALSVTKADGTNWANLGSAELGTIEQDLFAYVVWNTNLTPDAVDVFWSRVPYGRVYSDFSGTTTNEKYAAINATAPAATDECVCIGRFAATLSLTGTSHLWTVPTYTNVNLIHHPIFETRTLSWTPQHTRSGGAYSNLPTTALSEYQIIGRNMKLLEIHGQDATPGSSGFQRLTAPFTNPINRAPIILASNNTTGVQMSAYYIASSNIFEMYLYDGTAQATASQNYLINGMVRIG